MSANSVVPASSSLPKLPLKRLPSPTEDPPAKKPLLPKLFPKQPGPVPRGPSQPVPKMVIPRAGSAAPTQRVSGLTPVTYSVVPADQAMSALRDDRNPAIRGMTYKEKRQLSVKINGLPADKLGWFSLRYNGFRVLLSLSIGLETSTEPVSLCCTVCSITGELRKYCTHNWVFAGFQQEELGLVWFLLFMDSISMISLVDYLEGLLSGEVRSILREFRSESRPASRGGGSSLCSFS